MKSNGATRGARARQASSAADPKPLAASGKAAPVSGPVTAPAPANNPMQKAGVSCIKRLPAYLQLLRVLQAEGHEHVSGTVLATVHNLESVIVRKDLAITGIVGKPRIGFHVGELIGAIERFLGWDSATKAVLVGVGNLGAALLGYRGFENFGLRLVAAFDSDPRKIGQWINGHRVQPVDKLIAYARRGDVLLGVLAVPASAAQDAADLMVRAGIRGIWNFAPIKLAVPDYVVAQKEDLAEGLAVLSHRLRHVALSKPLP